MKDEQLDILLENAGLEPINAIELDGVNIGRDINDRFESIESNFGAIVYTDYLKGDKGDSLKFFKATIHLNADGTFNDKNIVDDIDIYYQRDGKYKKLDSESLYILIQEAFIDDNYKPIISNINNSISLICEYILHNGEYKYVLIGSLPWLYLDPNFTDDLNIKDKIEINMSRILVFQDGKFITFNNIPSLYWDKNTEYTNIDGTKQVGSYCWKINGVDTGLIARGPRGPRGADGNCFILKLNSTQETGGIGETSTYTINSIFKNVEDGYGWKEYDPFMSYGFREGGSCICILQKNDSSCIVFGVLAKNINDEWVVYTSDESNMLNLQGYNLNDYMSDLGIGSGGGNRGLFIPYTKKDDSSSTQSGHMIWADHKQERTGDNSLHIGPSKNVLDVEGSTSMLDNTKGADTLNLHYNTVGLNSLNSGAKNSSIVMGNNVKAIFTPSSITLSVKSNK